MENKILELLQSMNTKLDQNYINIANIRSDINNMNLKINSLENDVKNINTKMDRLEENQKSIKITVDSRKCNIDEITKDMHRVEVATAQNWTDIAQLKSIKHNF